MSEQDERVGTEETVWKARQYEEVYHRLQNLPEGERKEWENRLVLASLANGLPVVATEQGWLMTPFEVWLAVKRANDLQPDDQVTADHLIKAIAGQGIASTAVKISGPIQQWAQELMQELTGSLA